MAGRWTENRKKVADFLTEYFGTHGRAPTLDEISRATGLWKRSVEIVLKGLESMGIIRITPGISRGIQLVDAAFAQIPLMGDVEAGPPPQSQEVPTEYVRIDRRLVTFKDPVALRVRGFSMQDAGILPGDIVLIRNQKTAAHGETVVAYVNGGITVKKFHLRGQTVILKPANPTFKDIEVRRSDDFTILGKVMLILRDLGDCFDFHAEAASPATQQTALYPN